jgi:hypothetical protein
MSCTPTCVHPSPSQAHCGAADCHQTFGGVGTFDKHRRNGECLAPAELGLRLDHAGVWHRPMDEEARARFRESRS